MVSNSPYEMSLERETASSNVFQVNLSRIWNLLALCEWLLDLFRALATGTMLDDEVGFEPYLKMVQAGQQGSPLEIQLCALRFDLGVVVMSGRILGYHMNCLCVVLRLNLS